MNKYFRLIRQNLNNIYRFSITAITVILIIMLFPNIGNFKYEYQKGKPWMHETLIAPFDFSILKTEKELKSNRDSILTRFSPFFKTDTSIYPKIIKKFESNFAKKWNKFERSSSFKSLKYTQKRIEAEKTLTRNYLKSYLSNYYQKGIADLQNEQQKYNFELPKTINKSLNNLNELISVNDIYSSQKAYENLNKQIKEDFESSIFQGFIQDLNIDSYLEPNLFYDKEMSEQVKNSMLSNISLTKGKVDYGTRIVLRGDIINDETFLILESLKKDYENI
nr:hypothetical protein [uncultured Marinifilum sp.]